MASSWTFKTTLFQPRPLTSYDEYFSLLGMIIGASSLTFSAFLSSPSPHSNPSSSSALISFALLIFLLSFLWLLATAHRLGAPSIWNFLFWGNSFGGGAFGLAIFCLGKGEEEGLILKVFACAMWGWVVGVLVASWVERGKIWGEGKGLDASPQMMSGSSGSYY